MFLRLIYSFLCQCFPPYILSHPSTATMPPESRFPVLPCEVLFQIFNYLSASDLRRVLKANSYLREVCLPLTYRCGTFTQFGPHFPDAGSPLPFFDTNPSGARLSVDMQQRITSHVRRLNVGLHSSEMCRAFRFIIDKRLKFELEVLTVSLKGYGGFWDNGSRD